MKLKLTKKQVGNIKSFLKRKESDDFFGKIDLRMFNKTELNRLYYEKKGRDIVIKFYHQYTKAQLKKEKGNPKDLCVVGSILFKTMSVETREYHLYTKWLTFAKRFSDVKKFSLDMI